MFTLNCVPNGALPHIDRVEENHKLGTILEHGGKIESKGKRNHFGLAHVDKFGV